MHQILAYEWWGCTVHAFRRARRMAGWYESAQAPWEEWLIEGVHWDAVLLLFPQQLSSASGVGRCHSRNPTTFHGVKPIKLWIFSQTHLQAKRIRRVQWGQGPRLTLHQERVSGMVGRWVLHDARPHVATHRMAWIETSRVAKVDCGCWANLLAPKKNKCIRSSYKSDMKTKVNCEILWNCATVYILHRPVDSMAFAHETKVACLKALDIWSDRGILPPFLAIA